VKNIDFPALTICGQGSNEVVLNAGTDDSIYIFNLNKKKV
jgi:hypothetical protein